MSFKDYLLEKPLVFETWQLPFARQKLRRLLRHSDINGAQSVLDVGCGPGTNTALFSHCQYLGVDVNPRYITIARQRHQRDFLVADIMQADHLPPASFDFILLNSFLHHLNLDSTNAILSVLSRLLTGDGYIHSIELVVPTSKGVAHWLTLHDRGKFPRTLCAWREIFEEHFRTVVFESFSIRHLGMNILDLVYFKGRRK